MKRGACTWSLYLTKLDKAREARQLGVWEHAALEIFLISDLRSFLVPFLGDIARVGRPTAKSSLCKAFKRSQNLKEWLRFAPQRRIGKQPWAQGNFFS